MKSESSLRFRQLNSIRPHDKVPRVATPSKRNKTTKLPCGRERAQSAGVAPNQYDGLHARLKSYLEAEGLKYSEQRWKIAKVVLASAEHLSAQEIIRRVENEYPDIGAATVYRNIKVLCDARILRETLLDNEGRVVFEAFEDGHHDHIVCVDCGAIFEFHEPKIETLQETVADAMGFSEVRHRHVIYAHCKYKK